MMEKVFPIEMVKEGDRVYIQTKGYDEGALKELEVTLVGGGIVQLSEHLPVTVDLARERYKIHGIKRDGEFLAHPDNGATCPPPPCGCGSPLSPLVPWPEPGDNYWQVDPDGEVTRTRCDGDDYDSDSIDFGNCFRTREEAEVARDKIWALLRG